MPVEAVVGEGGAPRAIGSGTMRRITGTSPAAGVEFSESVPVGVQWRFISMHARLTASAVVGNRLVTLNLGDAALAAFYREPSGFTQLANQSIPYIWSDAGAFNSGLVFGFVQVPLPSQVILPVGFTMFSTTTGLLAGDQWSAIGFLVEEWTL